MKGATTGKKGLAIVYRVSIHAPVKGATRARRWIWERDRCFNPRSREGSDVEVLDKLMDLALFQSTLP